MFYDTLIKPGTNVKVLHNGYMLLHKEYRLLHNGYLLSHNGYMLSHGLLPIITTSWDMIHNISKFLDEGSIKNSIYNWYHNNL